MTAEKTCQQILEAAGEVFAEKGFKEATVREICGRASVNLAAINYHFGDKGKLYIAAVKNARRLLEAGAPLPEWTPETPPETKLELFVQTLVRRLLNRTAAPWQHRLLVREIMEPTQACEEMTQESFIPLMEILRSIIRELLPNELPDHEVWKLALSVIAQCVYYRFHDRVLALLIPQPELDEHFQAEFLAEHITRFSLSAIRSYSLHENPS